MIPFYKNYGDLSSDLYNVHGGFVNWTYEHLGIFSFTNELWNDRPDARHARPGRGQPERGPGQRRRGDAGRTTRLFANDKLLLRRRRSSPWKPAKHPVYGDIEIGGFVKESQPRPTDLHDRGALPPERRVRRLYHADQMPLITLSEVKSERLGEGLSAVTVTLTNSRLIPSVSAQAARRRVGIPDSLSLEGEGLEVIGGGVLVNRDTGEVRAADRDPASIKLEDGVGATPVRVRWYVRGAGEAKVKYASQKGGTAEAGVLLK